MPDNGLDVKITREQFKAITDPNKKLDAMFEVLITQKHNCENIVGKFNERLDKCDEVVKEAVNTPRRNRKIDVGLGSAGGVTGYVVIDKLIDLIKSYLSGG